MCAYLGYPGKDTRFFRNMCSMYHAMAKYKISTANHVGAVYFFWGSAVQNREEGLGTSANQYSSG